MKKLLAFSLMSLVNVSPAHAQRADPPISLSGTAEIRIGTPLAEVVRRNVLDQPVYPRNASCATAVYHYSPLKLNILAVGGRVSRIEFAAELENIPETSYVTPEGIRLGSTMEQVMAAYPSAVRSVNNNSGNIRFTVWRAELNRGWLFEISSRRNRVTRVFVGDRSIEYTEGCY